MSTSTSKRTPATPAPASTTTTSSKPLHYLIAQASVKMSEGGVSEIYFTRILNHKRMWTRPGQPNTTAHRFATEAAAEAYITEHNFPRAAFVIPYEPAP